MLHTRQSVSQPLFCTSPWNHIATTNLSILLCEQNLNCWSATHMILFHFIVTSISLMPLLLASLHPPAWLLKYPHMVILLPHHDIWHFYITLLGLSLFISWLPHLSSFPFLIILNCLDYYVSKFHINTQNSFAPSLRPSDHENNQPLMKPTIWFI